MESVILLVSAEVGGPIERSRDIKKEGTHRLGDDRRDWNESTMLMVITAEGGVTIPSRA